MTRGQFLAPFAGRHRGWRGEEREAERKIGRRISPQNVPRKCACGLQRELCVRSFFYIFKVVIGRGGSKRIRTGGGGVIEKARATSCVGYSRLELGLGWGWGNELYNEMKHSK